MSIPTSKYNAQNCTLGYQTTKGSCSYTLTLIEGSCATRHSPLATRHSPLAVPCSLALLLQSL